LFDAGTVWSFSEKLQIFDEEDAEAGEDPRRAEVTTCCFGSATSRFLPVLKYWLELQPMNWQSANKMTHKALRPRADDNRGAKSRLVEEWRLLGCYAVWLL
jgi:hypothetical protein